jgi:ribosomal protein L3 glutamine methyltransferase
MQDISTLLSIRDFIRWAVSRFNEQGLFFGHGTETAWDEAVALVLHSLHLPHDINPAVLDANLTHAEREKLYNLIEQRITKRIPLAYLTHEILFAGLSFYVDERVLIPRSPIAELIENQFQPWVDADKVNTILDLCTGSGCIAIACAKAFPDAMVDASDISNDALAVAKMNNLRHNTEDQVHLYQSDLFSALPAKKYDLIVTNPPYVSLEEMSALPKEYQHEPDLALTAGDLGLDFAIRILQKAPEYLATDGVLVMEVGNSEYALAEHFPELPFTWIEFERGGGGVCLLRREDLVD